MTKQSIENSEFQNLIGEWKTEGRVLAKGNEPEVHISGTDSYEWILDGYYILHKADVLMGEVRGQTFELIRVDEAGKAKFDYYNNQGASDIMLGLLENNRLTIEGDGLRFNGHVYFSNRISSAQKDTIIDILSDHKPQVHTWPKPG